MVHTNKTGSKCVDVDVVKNGHRVRVFTCLVTIILPKQTKHFYLSSIIGAYKKAHPQFAHATNFKIINNYYQPQMSSGTLTGLKVELLNSAKGTIAGSSLSGTAMIITSPMKLTNLGWIRGAGGRGGYGGTGGASGPYSKRVIATPAHTYSYGGSYWIKVSHDTHGIGLPVLPAGWTIHSKGIAVGSHTHFSWVRIKGPCGSVSEPIPFSGGHRLKSVCGIQLKIKVATAHRYTIAIGIGPGHWTRPATYKTITVAGHSGGAGGYGGQGIWWNHNATKGHVGATGGVNKTSGITGYRGGTGGKGADGATWGKAGVRGHQGGTGSHGHVGAYGPATGSHGPTGAGKAITGYRFLLHNGSHAGKLSGIHVN